MKETEIIPLVTMKALSCLVIDKVRIESYVSVLPQSEAEMQILTMLKMNQKASGRIFDELAFQFQRRGGKRLPV